MQEKLIEINTLMKKLQYKNIDILNLFTKIETNELFHSNKLEKNPVNYSDTLQILNSTYYRSTKYTGSTVLEILSYKEAQDFLVESYKANVKLSVDFIKDLHYILFKNLNPAYAGHIKQTQSNNSNERTKVNSTYAHLNNVLKSYLGDTASEHPIVAVARFKLGFIQCHSFLEGNGRISRLLMNYLLMQLGMYPCIISSEDKNEYFDALQDTLTSKDESIFINWFIDNYIKNLDNYLRTE